MNPILKLHCPAPSRLLAAVSLLALMAGCNHDNTSASTSTAATETTPVASSTVPSNGGANPNFTTSPTDVNAPATTPAVAENSSADNSGPTRSERHFWRRARMMNHRERAYSELASTKASDPQVRAFAQQIVSDRRQTNYPAMSGDDASLATAADWSASTADETDAMANGNTTSSSSNGYGTNSSTGSDTTGNRTIANDPNAVASTQPRSGPDANGNYPSDGTGREGYGPNSSNRMGGDPATSANSDNSNSTDRTTAGVERASDISTTVPRTDRAWSQDNWMKKDRGYAKLSEKTGADFDRAYLDMIIREEKMAVAMCERADKSGNKDDSTKRFANEHVEMHRERLQQAQNLRKNLS